MPTYSELEERIIKHYQRQYMHGVISNPLNAIYALVVDSIYGECSRDPLMEIDWGSLFNQNKCPACNGMISLNEKMYICGKCSLGITHQLFDDAEKQYNERLEIYRDETKLNEDIKSENIPPNRLKALNAIAQSRALEKIEEQIKELKKIK